MEEDYHNNEALLREKAIEYTIQHFMGKDNVSIKLFDEYLTKIYNFLKNTNNERQQ